MGLLEWKDEYRMGIADIDCAHQELIRIINDFYDALGPTADRESIQSFLDQVHVLASAEFHYEEELMNELRCEDYDQHRADHKRLLRDLRILADILKPTSTKDEISKALETQLGSWFSAHFRTFDARLHRFLRER